MKPIQRDDKSDLLFRCWKAAEPRAVFLLVHGLGSHSARMAFLAQFLHAKGISSYAIELKGFGETEGIRGHVDSFQTYYRDIRRLQEIAKEENPDKRIFLLGESLGGLICFLLVQKSSKLFQGLVCVTPAFKSKLKFSFSEYLQMVYAFLLNAKKQFVMHFDAAMCTRDIGYQQVIDHDQRDHRWATAGLLVKTLWGQLRCRWGRPKSEIPVLFLLAGRDEMVDTVTSAKIFERMKAKDKYIVEYPEMFHALTIDMEREYIFEDILEWINERLSYENDTRH